MGFLAKIISPISKSEPEPAVKRRPAQTLSFSSKDWILDVHKTDGKIDYGYNGAKVDRLTADWINVLTASQSKDREIKNELAILRARARDLCNNNDYAKKYVRLVQSNVIGPSGVKLQVKSKDYNETKKKWTEDKLANTKIEKAWTDWCKAKHCTVNGKLTFRQVCELIIAHAARDGEMFVKYVTGKQYKYGFTLQLIEPDHVDERKNIYNENETTVMGVKLDKQRRPLGYYIKKNSPNRSSGTYESDFVSADKILHLYDPERADQTRGVSWMAQSIIRLKMLDGYEEASLVNARASAAQAGFFETDPETNLEYEGDEVDSNDNIYMNLEAGVWQQLPPGVKAHAVNPEYPHPQHEMFVSRTLMGIASGLNVSYSSLSGDYSKANYSSERAAKLDERDQWKRIQGWFIDSFLNPVFAQWLKTALLSENLNLPNDKYDKFNAPVWYPRRWDWVDPQKDVEAKARELELKLTTRTKIAAEKGEDFEEILEQLQEEQEQLKSLGTTEEDNGSGNGNNESE